MYNILPPDVENDKLVMTRPLHSKIFFSATLTSLTFTIYSLYRVFRSTQLSQPLQSIKWQRFRMIGQAGIIAGLMGPLVWEGLGFDTWKIRREIETETENDTNKIDRLLNYSLGLFGRITETI